MDTSDMIKSLTWPDTKLCPKPTTQTATVQKKTPPFGSVSPLFGSNGISRFIFHHLTFGKFLEDSCNTTFVYIKYNKY